MTHHRPPPHKHKHQQLLLSHTPLLALKNHQNQTQNSNKVTEANYKMAQNLFLDHQDIIGRQPIVRRRSQLLRKMTPLVVSVSILFSLLLSHFSYPSLGLYFHSFRNSKLFTYTMDKNSMFLLCNGLLVFLAKFSRFIPRSSTSNDNLPLQQGANNGTSSTWSNYYDHGGSTTPILKLEEEPIVSESVSTHEASQGLEAIEDVQEKGGGEMESGFLITGKEGNYIEVETSFEKEEDGDHQGEEELVVDEEPSALEGAEEENALLSTEELNKKFDEFIRRMKEGIRFEANQQRLVLVK